jgi:DNA-binding transcriptional ArsR family regulator
MLNRMVEDVELLDRVFGSLADPTRRAMVRMLAGGELSVGELAEPFAMSFAGASKHVRVLEEAGLVRRTVQGRRHSCSLVATRLAEADAWFDFYTRFWTARLDDLEGAIKLEAATNPVEPTQREEKAITVDATNRPAAASPGERNNLKGATDGYDGNAND